MKRTYLILSLIILLGNNIFAQKFVSKTQEEYYNDGLKYLNKNNLRTAFTFFHHIQLVDPKTFFGIAARKKVDSILPTIQKELVQNLQGLWELKELHFDPYPGKFSDYIEFHSDKIIFYMKTENGKKIIREETLNFKKYDSSSVWMENQFVFKNSEIWSFGIITRKRLKKLYPTIDRDSVGGAIILLDERGIIINKRARKKELKKELYTFYTLQK